MKKILKLGLCSLIVMPALVSAASYKFTPIKNYPPDWSEAKQEGEETYDRILRFYAHDDEAKKFFDDTRKMLYRVEQNDRVTTRKNIEFFRTHPVDGISFEELKSRVEFVFNAHMAVNYGWFMPEIVNEGLAEAAKKEKIPGYPMKLFITDSDYCEQFRVYGLEIDDFMNNLVPGTVPPNAASLCEGRLEPLSGKHVLR